MFPLRNKVKRRRSPGADLPGTGVGGVACVFGCFGVVDGWWQLECVVIVGCGGYGGVTRS